MSSADHPQSDGQAERTNRTVIEILRGFVNERNNKQVDFLPIVEIAINNSKSVSTGYSPFFSNYGYHPNFVAFDNNSQSVQTKLPSVESYVKTLKSVNQHIKEYIQKSQSNQKYYADMKRSEHQFKVGDIVYVDSSHFRIQSGANN